MRLFDCGLHVYVLSLTLFTRLIWAIYMIMRNPYCNLTNSFGVLCSFGWHFYPVVLNGIIFNQITSYGLRQCSVTWALTKMLEF